MTNGTNFKLLVGFEPPTDETALQYLRKYAKSGQWLLIEEALRIIQERSGHGEIVLHVSDGFIGDHPRVEVSL